MRKLRMVILIAALLTISLMTGIAFAENETGSGILQEDSLENGFHISQWNGTNWKEMYCLQFPVQYATEEFELAAVDGEITLRIVQTGLPFSDIDQAKLVACGQYLDPEYARYVEQGPEILDDIATIDHNVILMHEKEIEISWRLPEDCDAGILRLNANEYGRGVPARFPLAGYVSYEMGSIKGSITVDGIIEETDGKDPLYSPFWKPTTGHPDGYTYIYVCDDSENIYFSIDATIDNNNDYGEDWAQITILTANDTVRSFRIDDFSDKWGMAGFGITSKVSYKHQTYEFSIPKSIIGNNDIKFRLEYYGTAAFNDLVVTKVDSPDPVIAGTQLTYTITVQNLGVAEALDVVVTDTLPPGVSNPVTVGAAEDPNGVPTATLGSIPAGGTASYTITVDVDSDTLGIITNTASGTCSSFADIDPSNNIASEDTTVIAQADIQVTKTDGVTTAIPGQSVTYTIVVTNNGPSDDPSVSVIDTFPVGVTATYTSVAAGGATGNTAAGAGDLTETLNMPVGSSVTYTVIASIDSGATGTLSNVVNAVASGTDPLPSNDFAVDNDTVLAPEADLVITKTGSPNPVLAGSQLTYTITVQNLGPSDAQNVVVTDTLPPGVSNPVTNGAAEDPNGVPTATLGTIAAGASAQYTITVDVDLGASGTITNSAVVNSITPDPNPNNNAAGQGASIERDGAGQYGGLGGPTVGGRVMMVSKSVIVTRLILLPVQLIVEMIVH